jgi:hypothetical protein
VVDTNGFNDRGWLDTRKGRPHSDARDCDRTVPPPRLRPHRPRRHR